MGQVRVTLARAHPRRVSLPEAWGSDWVLYGPQPVEPALRASTKMAACKEQSLLRKLRPQEPDAKGSCCRPYHPQLLFNKVFNPRKLFHGDYSSDIACNGSLENTEPCWCSTSRKLAFRVVLIGELSVQPNSNKQVNVMVVWRSRTLSSIAVGCFLSQVGQFAAHSPISWLPRKIDKSDEFPWLLLVYDVYEIT